MQYLYLSVPFTSPGGSYAPAAPQWILDQLRQEIKLVLRLTSYWILYGALALTLVSVLVSALKGLAL